MIIYLKMTALQFKVGARLLTKRAAADPNVEVYDKDGWYQPDPNGPRYYFNFDVCFGTGVVYSSAPTGTTVDANGNTIPTYTKRAGVHVNLNWTGPIEVLPTQLLAFQVFPVTPAVVFG